MNCIFLIKVIFLLEPNFLIEFMWTENIQCIVDNSCLFSSSFDKKKRMNSFYNFLCSGKNVTQLIIYDLIVGYFSL